MQQRGVIDANHAQEGIFVWKPPKGAEPNLGDSIPIYDIAPSILKRYGIDTPPSMIGKSLLQHWRRRTIVSKGFTLWFTGLSGAGKSTLANEIEGEFLERGLPIDVLDGDVFRTYLRIGLGYGREDRDTNIRRIGFVADLLTRNGVITIVAAISPYDALRKEVRAKIGRFVEVFCKCPLEVLVERDVKGLYKKALAGEIENFTGVSDPYEEPDDAEIVAETDKESVEQSVAKIIRTLELMGHIPVTGDGTECSNEEEEEIKKRLTALGYL